MVVLLSLSSMNNYLKKMMACNSLNNQYLCLLHQINQLKKHKLINSIALYNLLIQMNNKGKRQICKNSLKHSKTFLLTTAITSQAQNCHFLITMFKFKTTN